MYLPERNGANATPTLRAATLLFLPPLNQPQWREMLTYLFVGLLVLLVGVGVVVAYHFSLPQKQLVILGSATQFPLAQPRPVALDGAQVWVVNTGQGFIALDATPNDSTRCGVIWEGSFHAEYQWYVDPCRGTRYTMFGVYAYSGPPPYRTLDRYPVRVEANGDLAIELTTPIEGVPLDKMPGSCVDHRQPQPWQEPWLISAIKPPQTWLDACNQSWLEYGRTTHK